MMCVWSERACSKIENWSKLICVTEFILIGSIGAEVIENIYISVHIIFGIVMRCDALRSNNDDAVYLLQKYCNQNWSFVTLAHKLVSINWNFNERNHGEKNDPNHKLMCICAFRILHAFPPTTTKKALANVLTAMSYMV